MASDRPWESLRRERVYYAAGLRLGFDVQSARRTSDGMNRAEHQNPYPRPNREGVNPLPYKDNGQFTYAGFTVSFSVQWTVAVICMTMKSVRIAPMVIDRPVKPSKKKA
jgi:hypothetical protein